MDYKIGRRYSHSTFKSNKPVIMFEENRWDDYGFKTLFNVYYYNNNQCISIGYINIAEKDATRDTLGRYSTIEYFFDGTSETIIDFPSNTDNIISLGQSEFYTGLHNIDVENFDKQEFLFKIGDLANNLEKFDMYKNFDVVSDSFLRGVNEFVVKNELHNLAIYNKFKEYTFITKYSSEGKEKSVLNFHTNPRTTLPSNIHAIIGENGSGKTTFLKDLVDIARLGTNTIKSNFSDSSQISLEVLPILNDEIGSIENIYEIFESVLFISFSAFDNFDFKNVDSNNIKNFDYVTLFEKEYQDDSITSNELGKEENIKKIDLLSQYKQQLKKIYNTVEKIEDLQSAHNNLNLFFESIYTMSNDKTNDALDEILLRDGNREIENLVQRFRSYSSGQKIILLSIAALIANVRQQTLVIFDEPELYLHPPMATSFIRIISEIVHKKNGVCIMATHSPIILQEIPNNCVHVVDKYSEFFTTNSPKNQTFGENVSILNDQVFGLDIRESGFFNFINNFYYNNYEIDKLRRVDLGSVAENYLELLMLRDMDEMDGDDFV